MLMTDVYTDVKYIKMHQPFPLWWGLQLVCLNSELALSLKEKKKYNSGKQKCTGGTLIRNTLNSSRPRNKYKF